ncbi:MAG: radical SAM protein [Nitrospiraceae bacterium]|nr:radical SAM protein [Nitrospiraceae bacterium]
MKIVLLEHPRTQSPERCNDIANTPLSSCLLTGYTAAALLAEGHEVEVIEGYLEGLSYREIGRRVRQAGPDILGVHMVYTWGTGKRLAGFLSRLKKEGAAPFIAAYGYYPTFAAKDLLSGPAGAGPFAIDAVLLGEPELTFAALAGRLASGRPHGGRPFSPLRDIPGLAKVPGLATAENGGGNFMSSPPVIARDLDALRFPLRTGAMWRLPEVSLLGSRGCYGRCAFCHITSFFGDGSRLWRGRSPENIVLEIDSVIDSKGARDFYFTDPQFFGPGAAGQERAIRLASMLGERDIRFGLEARANDIKDKSISALAKAGLRHILIGIESGSDRVLRRLEKMTSVAENEEAIRTLRRYGIEPNAGFIMFEPDSSAEDIKENFRFLKRNGLLGNLQVAANVLSHHQIILGGTETFSALRKEGRLRMETTYEGMPEFRDPQVRALAVIMRRAANLVFRSMDGIWSGRVPAPPGAENTCRRINDFLVGFFEENLERLSSGGRGGGRDLSADIPEDFIHRAVEEAEAKISELMTGLPVTGFFKQDFFMKQRGQAT